MKTKLVITPQLLQEMEETVRNSASFKTKMAEAKAHVEKNKVFLDAIFSQIKGK